MPFTIHSLVLEDVYQLMGTPQGLDHDMVQLKGMPQCCFKVCTSGLEIGPRFGK